LSRKALFDELRNIQLRLASGNVVSEGITLAKAISRLKDPLALARAESDQPTDVYDLDAASRLDLSQNPPDRKQINVSYLLVLQTGKIAQGGILYGIFKEAIREEQGERSAAGQPWLKIPGEVAGMIKAEPVDGDSYYLRLVYEHAPCAPVVSEPSQPFTFAKVFDPDAPARQIRIELPSIDLRDLRKFKRGVGMQMSPQLSKVLSRVHPGMLQGQGLLSTEVGAVGLAVICTFSLPIITLVALIVMFLFLLLFNIIFWWLPFIMICFPILRRK
jgi:hypothetical protein